MLPVRLRMVLVVGLLASCRPAAATSSTPPSSSSDGVSPTPELEPLGVPLSRGLPGRALGTEHPVRVGMAGTDGSWALLCQARSDTDGDGEIDVRQQMLSFEGDEPTPYLVLGSGPGHAMPVSMTASADGRWLAFVEEGGVGVVDTVASTLRLLPPLVADEPATLRFSEDGTHLVGWFTGSDEPRLEVHRLADGEHWSVDMGPGVLTKLRIDPAGRSLWIETAREDTNGDGRIDGPTRSSTLDHACGYHASFGMMADRRELDAVQIRRARLEPGAVLEDEPGGLLELSGGILAREADGALVLRGSAGPRRVTDASCGGIVVRSAPDGGSAVIACVASDGALHLLHGDGSIEALGSGMRSYAERFGGPEILGVGTNTVVNLSTRARTVLPDYDHLLGGFAPSEGVVVRRAGALVHHRLQGDPEGTWLGPTPHWQIRAAVEGRLVISDGTESRMIDMATGAEIGRMEGEAHGLSIDERVLLGPPRAAMDAPPDPVPMRAWPRGPLRWHAPSPAPR